MLHQRQMRKSVITIVRHFIQLTRCPLHGRQQEEWWAYLAIFVCLLETMTGYSVAVLRSFDFTNGVKFQFKDEFTENGQILARDKIRFHYPLLVLCLHGYKNGYFHLLFLLFSFFPFQRQFFKTSIIILNYQQTYMLISYLIHLTGFTLFRATSLRRAQFTGILLQETFLLGTVKNSRLETLV